MYDLRRNFNASNRLHAWNGRTKTVFACVAVCACELKSCKDHVDDSHPIDLYTFISVNIEDGSFYIHYTYTYCKPQNLGYECSSVFLLIFLNFCATSFSYAQLHQRKTMYRAHRAQVSYDKINTVNLNIKEMI